MMVPSIPTTAWLRELTITPPTALITTASVKQNPNFFEAVSIFAVLSKRLPIKLNLFGFADIYSLFLIICLISFILFKLEYSPPQHFQYNLQLLSSSCQYRCTTTLSSQHLYHHQILLTNPRPVLLQ